MDRGNTKREILNASLDLFSVQGFEATSISQIADRVGIRKASLYSHFESKQAILDALVKDILEKYSQHSVIAKTDNSADVGVDDILTPDKVAQMVKSQILYVIHDPYISKARKMLVIEQFQNPELAKLQTKQNYLDIMGYFTELIKRLINNGTLTNEDPEIMAAQLCLPISVWINLCDREPECEPQVMQLAEKHILQFFEIYKPR